MIGSHERLSMIGRKTVTYSKRKPLITVPSVRDDPEERHTEEPPLPPATTSRDDDWVSTIGKSIRNLAIETPSPQQCCKPRKSGIRSRLSVAPSLEEFGQLLQCCQQKTETRFGDWYGGMKSYSLWL